MAVEIVEQTTCDDALCTLWMAQLKLANQITDLQWDFEGQTDAAAQRQCEAEIAEQWGILKAEIDRGAATLLVAKDTQTGRALASVMLLRHGSHLSVHLPHALEGYASHPLADEDKAKLGCARLLQIENFITDTDYLRPAQVTVMMQKLGRAIDNIITKEAIDVVYASVVNHDLPVIIGRLMQRPSQRHAPVALYQIPADHAHHNALTIAVYHPDFILPSLQQRCVQPRGVERS